MYTAYTVVFKPSGWQLFRTCSCLVQAFHSRAIQAILYSHLRDAGHQRRTVQPRFHALDDQRRVCLAHALVLHVEACDIAVEVGISVPMTLSNICPRERLVRDSDLGIVSFGLPIARYRLLVYVT